ncbi:MAG: glycosyltransferase family 39 protein, partial [Anaerolineae bacterium]|nr:glycosyltransferase family 39 protein [Anaerolineae bacterium]
MPGKSGTRASLFAILLIALALRLWRLGADSLWYDETVTLFIAQEDLARLTAHTAGDIHPPLYYYLQHFWLRLAGAGEFSAAFVSCFFGVLLVALVYRLARDLTGQEPLALLAGLLVALSPYHLWYSQEVRMYTLGASLGLVAALALWRWWRAVQAPEGSLGARWLAGYALAAALGLYTLYYFAFLLAFLGLWGLAMAWRAGRPGAHRWRVVLAWCGAQATALTLFGPWLPIAFRQATVPPVPPWRSFTPLAQVLRDSWTALSVGQSLPPRLAWPWLAVAALLVAWGLASLARAGKGWEAFFLGGYVAFPLAVIYAASYATPLFHPRYLFTYAPPFSILLAAGLTRLRRWGRWLQVAVLVALLGGYAWSAWRFATLPDYRADDHRGAVRYLEARLAPGDAVLVNAGYAYTALEVYRQEPVAWRGRLVAYPQKPTPAEGWVLLQTGSIGGAPTLGWGDPRSDFYPMDAAAARAALEEVFRRHPRVWVYRCYDTVTDPQGLIRGWLEEMGTRFDDQVFAGASNLRVQGYLSRLWREERVGPGSSLFGGALRLLEASARAEEGARRRVWVTLTWQKVDAIPEEWAVSVRLYDGEGHRIAQADGVPGGPLHSPQRWAVGEKVRHPLRLDLPAGTPPGTYALRLAVYRPSDLVPQPDESGRTETPIGEVALAQPDRRPAQAGQGVPYGARFALGARLLDFRLSTTEPAPGEAVRLELLWGREGEGPAATPILFIQVLGEDGRLWFAQEAPLGGPGRPFASWAAGEKVRTLHTIRLPADTPHGGYALVIGLLNPSDRSRIPVALARAFRADHLHLATLAVIAREPLPPPAGTLPHRAGVSFGGQVQLEGFALAPEEVRPGDSLAVRLRWRTLRVMNADYQAFLHLTAPGDLHPLAQVDAPPATGDLPTARWLPGEVLEGTLTLPIPADLPPGAYHLRLGLYDPQTGRRLPAADAEGTPLGDA